MKNLILNFSKRITMGLVMLMLIVSVVGFWSTDAKEVQATEQTEATETVGDGYVSVKYADVTAYIKEDGYVAPTYGTAGEWLFAGWYKDATCEETYDDIAASTENAYAKFVPSDILSAKLQLKATTTAESETTNMRIVSSVDSLNYRSVGFEIYYNGATTPVTVKTSTVYERIVASHESGVDYNFGPKVVDVESEYFVTATLLNIKNANFGNGFHIKPYWVTMDNTKVYGVSRYVTVNNGLDTNNINTPIYVGDINPTDVTVKVGETEYTAAKAYYEAPYAHLNVTVENRDGVLPSLTEFAVTGTVSASFEYRNTTTQYEGTADTSWYNTTDEKFVVLTSADLYGFAEVVNTNKDLFKDKTVYLGADITVNDGTAYINEDGTAGFTLTDASDTLYDWTPISPDEYDSSGTLLKYRFNGTFDGQEHTISGIYMLENEKGNTNGCYHGLFGITNTSSLVTNFSLKNSVFIVKDGCGSSDGTQADLGSIVGQPMGDVSNIYSNAIVVSENGIETGGLFGRLNPSGASYTSDITNCWFDGEVYVTYDAYDETTGTYGNSKEMYVGGIVGKIFNQGKVNITACLNTGKVTCIQNALATYNSSNAENTKFAVAGLVGGLTDSSAHTLYLNMTQCMNAGEIVAKRVVPTTTDSTTTYTMTQVTSGLGVAHLLYNKITTTSTDEEGNTVRDRMVVTDCLYTTDDFETGYQRSSSTGNYLPSNCEGAVASTYEGIDAWTSAERLGIYTNDEKDATKYWVVKEDGLVGLKTFTDEWIDFGWYYNNKTDNADTFVIETAEELYAFSHFSQTDTFKGDTVELGADIKMNSGTASSWAAGTTTPARQFKPIGKGASGATATAFAGTFDGKGHEVSGIYVNETATAGNGFFGQISSTSTVKNFKLTNSYILNNTGTHNTGAIVGNVRNGSVSNIYTDAIVVSAGSASMATGGLVGIFSGTGSTEKKISNSWFAGTVSSPYRYTGGIVGRIYGGTKTIENCMVSGTVTGAQYTGGIIGGIDQDTNNPNLDVQLINCVNTSAVTSSNAAYSGAVVGYTDSKTEIKNVYTTTTLGTALDGVGTLALGSSYMTGQPAVVTKTEITGNNAYIYTDLDLYSADKTNAVWGVTTSGELVLAGLCDDSLMTAFTGQRVSEEWYYNYTSRTGGDATDLTGTYTIQNVDDFYGLARLVNGGQAFTNKIVKLIEGKTYDLNAGWSVEAAVTENTDDAGNVTSVDVTVSTSGKANTWTPIGSSSTVYFDGTFDGNMATIKGLYVNRTSQRAGLFGYAGENSVIKSFALDNSYIKNTAAYTGAVVAITEGEVDEIYSKAIVDGGSAQNVGGIVAYYAGTSEDEKKISNCWFDGVVTGSARYVGGIVGRVYTGFKTIEDCLNTGQIVNTLSTDSASCSFTGGIAGAIYDSSKGLTSYVKTSMNAGYVYSYHGGAVGSVVGRSVTNPTIYIEDVYTTGDAVTTETLATNSTTTGFGSVSVSNATVTGTAVQYASDDISGTDAYIYTELDFWSEDNQDGKWVAIEGAIPELKSFSKETAISSFNGIDRISTGWYYNAWTYNCLKANGYDCTSVTTEYSIETEADLRGLAELVNSGVEDFGKYTNSNETLTVAQKTVKLANDIIFNNVTTGEEAAGWADGSITAPTTSWVPIGTVNGNDAVNAFQGTFDGDGHTISGLYVASEEQYLGLFRKIQDATICNLDLVNSYIVNTTEDAADTIMGSIAGGGDGTFESVYSNAIVQGKRIVGGLIGRVSQSSNDNTEMTLNSCWFDGLVDINYKGASRIYGGGLVGFPVHGTTVMDTCLYTGAIDLDINYTGTGGTFGPQIGGLCSGDNTNTSSHVEVVNCVSAGEIHSTVLTCEQNPNLTYIGSVYGDVKNASSSAANTLALTTMTDIKESTGATSTRTAVSYNSKNNGASVSVDKTFMGDPEVMYGLGAQMWTALAFTDSYRLALDNAALAEGEEKITVAGPIWASVEGQLPVPATLAENPLDTSKPDMELAGEGTEASPFLITTVDELVGFAKLSKINTFKGQYVALGNDIIINEGESASDWAEGKAAPTFPWHAVIGIGADGKRFEGTFDGKNYTISGICLESKETYLGLFAATEEGSAIKNLRLENSYIEQEGDGYTGSIVSDCRGTVSNVYSDAIVESGNEQVGGIIGRANGCSYANAADEDDTTDGRTSVAMDNCWYAGDIILTGEGRYAGGIIGAVIQGEWTLTNCVFTGKITCEYTGTSYAYVGGICGALNTPSTVESSSKETKLTLESCISAGTIKTANKDYGAGAILGRAKADIWFNSTTSSTTDETTGETVETTTTTFKDSKVSHIVMNNVFATREAGYQEVGHSGTVTESDSAGTEYKATPTVSGAAVWTNNADRLVGYCTEEVKDGYYVGGSLDFTSTFVIREEGVPVPATFTDLDNVTQVATSDLNTILALTTMDSTWSLENAVNYGLGHYVLTSTGKTYENYTAYLTALEAQDFTPYTTLEETGTDGVYNMIYTRTAGEWVLNVLFVQNTGEVTLTISNGLDSLSADLEPETSTTSGDVTLSMLQLEGSKSDLDEAKGYTDYFYGNSFVFKLPNGHFIINDGGNSGDMAGLMAYLRKEAELSAGDTTTKIYIDAWTVTHQHGDHFGVMKNIVSNPSYAEQLVVSAIYLNEPSQNAMLCYPENTNVMNAVKAQYRGIRLLKDKDGNTPKVYWCQTGQRYYFDGLTMDIIQSQEQIPVSDYGYYNIGAVATGKKDFNTVSTNMLFTTANGKKVLITGDSNDVNMEYIMNAYGDTSKGLANINVYQVPHHGKNTSYNIANADNTFTDYLAGLATNGITSGKFDVSLFPCSVFYEYDGKHESYVFPGAEGANKHLIDEKSTSSYHYGAGTVKVTLSDTISSELDTSVDTGTEDSETGSGDE